MNLSTLLNDESEGSNKPPRKLSGPYSRQPPLPALRTDPYRSPGGPPSRQSSLESQNPALLHSPAIQRLSRPEHVYQNPYSPGGSAQYSQNHPPLSPYTTSSISPGNPHPYGHRPSSHPSVPSTPSSTHTQTPHTYHESPGSNYPYPTGVTAYSHNPVSQPGTPLGPPSGPFRLPSHSSRDPPSILTALQSPSPGNHGTHGGQYRPVAQSSISHIVNAPTNYHQIPPSAHSPVRAKTSDSDDRERSVSVSPKTVLTALPPRLNSVLSRGYTLDGPPANTKDIPEKRSYHVTEALHNSRERDVYLTSVPESSSSLGISSPSAFLVDPLQQQKFATPLDAEILKMQDVAVTDRLATQVLQENNIPPVSAPSPRNSNIKTMEYLPVPRANSPQSTPIEVRGNTTPILIESPKVKPQTMVAPRPTPLKRAHPTESIHAGSETPPPSKRKRFAEIPIWAQRSKYTSPLPKYRHTTITNGGNHKDSSKPVLKTTIAPHNAMDVNNDTGMWEPTFTNIIPHDEITKILCDFLFTHVVVNEDLQTRPSSDQPASESLLEIEAKLGTIVDRSTNKRINLPIQTEAILHQDANVAFESMMTVEQHRMFNEKLNEAFQQSQGLSNAKPRNAMSYSHTNEKDSFYELPLSELAALPASIRGRLGARKAKLRITRNAKTGNITAQIVKVRIADLHVFSPRTHFDWRVSVSAEVNWNGDVEKLANASQDTQHNGMPDRNKDRVSYKHQYCQIDLTQVKANMTVGAGNATHELEVELDTTMVRQQGIAAMRGQPQRYEELVRGFTNNVRTLARALG